MTQDTTQSKNAKLPITSSEGHTFDRAFADYPPNGWLTFSGVALYDYNFNQISDPNWSFANFSSGLTPQCGYDVQISAKQVTLDYSPYAVAVLADHPVAYYRLGEGLGATVAQDSFVTRISGRYENGRQLGIAGLIANTTNTAVNFTTGDVVIPDNPGLAFVGTPFTIEAWVNGTYAIQMRVFDKSGAGMSTGYGMDLANNNVRILGDTTFTTTI